MLVLIGVGARTGTVVKYPYQLVNCHYVRDSGSGRHVVRLSLRYKSESRAEVKVTFRTPPTDDHRLHHIFTIL